MLKELIEKRKEDNKELLSKLSKFLEENPEMRFMQALYAFKLIDWLGEDYFYEEPSETLKRIK